MSLPSVEFDSENFDDFVQLFSDHGFVRIENVFSDSEIEKVKQEMNQIVNQFDPTDHPKSIFRTDDESKHLVDQYFLDSVDKIRFFYEDEAISKENGEFLVDKSKSLNKVGHGLHWRNPTFKNLTFSDPIKQPRIGGAVTEHIDSTFLHVNLGERLVGVWIALDDSTVENGCLHFASGSHKAVNRVNPYRFVRNADNSIKLLKYIGEKPNYSANTFVPVSVKKGSLVLIDGDVIHKSESNKSDKSRHAYTFHVVDTIGWDPLNWLVSNTLMNSFKATRNAGLQISFVVLNRDKFVNFFYTLIILQ